MGGPKPGEVQEVAELAIDRSHRFWTLRFMNAPPKIFCNRDHMQHRPQTATTESSAKTLTGLVTVNNANKIATAVLD